MRVSTKSVVKSIEKNAISSSIWLKSFIQMAKYSLFEDRSIYQSLCDALFIFLLGKVLSVSARIGESIIITVEPRLSGLFDYPDFFLWSQFFHEYELVVILKTQSRKKPNNPFKRMCGFQNSQVRRDKEIF